jgi:hypothetical protein
MLTDSDRVQLAPYLARIHAARAAVPGAERAAEQAERDLISFRRSTTVWDRWLNRDGPVGLAYREAKKVRQDTAAVTSGLHDQVKELYAALDRRIEPMMPRLDPRYDARSLLAESCARAARECQAVRHPIDALVETVRDATQNGRDEKARQEAVSARLRYPGHLRQAAKAVAALKFAVEPVSEAAALAGTPEPSLRWHDTAFDRLPRTAEGVAGLGRLARELPKLRGTRSRVDRLRADLLEVQRRTARAQRAAMIGARDRLLEESAP